MQCVPFVPARFGFILFVVAILMLAPLPRAGPAYATEAGQGSKVVLLFFWGEGCPHCARAKPFLGELEKRYPGLDVRSYEVLNNPENLKLLEDTAKARGTTVSAVPAFFINGRLLEGFDEAVSRELETAVRKALGKGGTGSGAAGQGGRGRQEALDVPFFGKADARSLSLPLFTVVVALLDSFNPCAFFVLFALLSLLVHAHSRARMLLIGGVFTIMSGCFYYLFMAAWLNLFFLVGHLSAVTRLAGGVALIIALINIKEFFFFRRGVTLTIPSESKPKLYERMRRLLRTDSLPGVLAGTVVLSAAANSYELLCTAGFPMVYTRVLTLNELTGAGYYAYLALYNLIYVIPLSAIVVFFVFTMGSRKLTEHQGKVLKLLSGMMMLGLAVVLLTDPSLLQNALISALLLLAVLGITSLLVLLEKKLHLS